MSIPFFTTKREAKDFWDPIHGVGEVVKVYVPKERGFLQARKGGNYYICSKYATQLKLKRVK